MYRIPVYHTCLSLSLSLAIKIYSAKSSQSSCHQHSAGPDGSDSLKTISGGVSGWREVPPKTREANLPRKNCCDSHSSKCFFWVCHREQGEIGWHIFASTHLFKKKNLIHSRCSELWVGIRYWPRRKRSFGYTLIWTASCSRCPVPMMPGVEAVGVPVVW